MIRTSWVFWYRC